jgi:hypothetical protein
MAGTVGQPIIGRATSSSHAGALGFWYTYPYAFTTRIPGWHPAVTGIAASVDVAPNPAADRVRLTLALPTSGHTTLTLVDAKGAIIRRLIDQHVAAGTVSLTLLLRELASGNYTVVLDQESERVAARLRVVK